jgi:hypothetical protein
MPQIQPDMTRMQEYTKKFLILLYEEQKLSVQLAMIYLFLKNDSSQQE